MRLVYCSANRMFLEIRIITFNGILSNQIASFMIWFSIYYNNSIITALIELIPSAQPNFKDYDYSRDEMVKYKTTSIKDLGKIWITIPFEVDPLVVFWRLILEFCIGN